MLAYCQAKGFGGIVINKMETRTFKEIGKGDNHRAKHEQALRELGCEFES